jgi:hypothetical protein
MMSIGKAARTFCLAGMAIGCEFVFPQTLFCFTKIPATPLKAKTQTHPTLADNVNDYSSAKVISTRKNER